MYGLMEESMLDSGSTIKCMGEVNIVGAMGGDMMGSINMTRNMVMEHILGLMVEDTKVSGSTARDMEKEEL